MSRFTFTLILFFQIVGCAALRAQIENLITLSKKNIQILSFEEGDSMVPVLNAKRIKAIYGFFNEKTAINHLSNLIDPEEIHLKLRAGCDYSFDFLTRFPNLRILSISYFSEESNPEISGHYCSPLNVSFLEKLPNLEILILHHEGIILNIEKVTSLKKLIYLNISPSSFSPDLFAIHSSLQQIEFGTQSYLSFIKSEKWIPLKINYHHDERDFFSIKNTEYKLFLKRNYKFQNLSVWPSSIFRKSDVGDTLVYVSDIQARNIEWTISKSYGLDFDEMKVLYRGMKDSTANGTVIQELFIYPKATCSVTQKNDNQIKISWNYFDENNQKVDSKVNEYDY